MSIQAQLSGVFYAHGGKQIFEDLTFTIKEGDRLALIGVNGAGKSTLFGLVARQLEPDRGAVTWSRGVTVSYLHQHSHSRPEMTVIDTVALAAGDSAAIDRRLAFLESSMGEQLDDAALLAVMDEYNHLLERMESARTGVASEQGAVILSGLRIPQNEWTEPVGNLSGGEQRIMALAETLAEAPALLLLDEPDNHLDLVAKNWLEDLLRVYPGAVATITHDRRFMDRVANQIFELEDGKLITWPGNYSAFVAQKQAAYERRHELRKLQERDFRKLKASAEQLTQWAHENPKLAGRAENQRRKLALERENLRETAPPPLERRKADLTFNTDRGGSLVLQAKGISKRYDDQVIFRPFDLEIWHGERIGLVGPNGAGKTTLARVLLEDETAESGSSRLGSSIKVGYSSQRMDSLPDDLTPLEFARKQKAMTEFQAISFLNSLLFNRETAMTPIKGLSGGEKARLQLGGLILSGANFLVLDEPTNNLDIAGVEALESALQDYDGTILAISHDRYFLERICNRIIEIDGGTVSDFPGDYDWYLANPDRGVRLN